MDGMFFKIIWAAVLLFFIIRMIPVAKHWVENGPKGSSAEWLNAGLLLAGVVGFVVFLMYIT